MHPIDYNLGLSQAILEEFEPYLLSELIFWPLSQRPGPGLPPYPRLTLGGLLLAMDELKAQEADMTPTQAADNSRLRLHYNQTLSKWRASMEAKAIRETNSRLNLWRSFLLDMEEKTRFREDYVREVRHRVMISRLSELASEQPDFRPLAQIITRLDRRLRALLRFEDFIWDPLLSPGYPRDRYWFLYGHPKIPDD